MIPIPDEQEWRAEAACRYSKREQHADLIQRGFDGRHWATITPLEWMSQWFAEHGRNRDPYTFARTVCETRCPVFAQCTEYARTDYDQSALMSYGLIAGRSPSDRHPRSRNQFAADRREEAMLRRHREAWAKQESA